MLELRDISKKYGDFSLDGISLEVKKGDYFVVLGVSGAGKSLLLEMIAGLVIPDNGTIVINGKDITRERIQDRHVGLVFQDHAIFPHLTVRENIGYGLRNKKITKEEIRRRTGTLAQQMTITMLLERRPATLSGGELQRVALARTLASDPTLLLLDEPLASLDVQIRSGLRRLLRQIHQNGQTIIHVTHDYEEAISLATRIAVLHEGKIVQSGTADEVFHRPRSEFVAHFIGIRNFFPAVLTGMSGHNDGTAMAIVNDTVRVTLLSGLPRCQGNIMIRGEDIFISRHKAATSAVNNFEGKITDIHPGIHGMELNIDAGIHLVAVVTKQSLNDLEIKEGDTVWASFKASAVRFIES
jgi:molybdopterin-binding protein